jgi:hypothetical protein
VSRIPNLYVLSAQVLAEVEDAERVKQAETAVIREVAPGFQSEIGQLMRKVAAELRNQNDEVTYEDLNAFREGRL